jgi:hypothetical protein
MSRNTLADDIIEALDETTMEAEGDDELLAERLVPRLLLLFDVELQPGMLRRLVLRELDELDGARALSLASIPTTIKPSAQP